MSFAGHAYFHYDYVALPEGVEDIDKPIGTGFFLECDFFLDGSEDAYHAKHGCARREQRETHKERLVFVASWSAHDEASDPDRAPIALAAPPHSGRHFLS